jgi:hypothetical protein
VKSELKKIIPRHLGFLSRGRFSVFFCLPGVIEMLQEWLKQITKNKYYRLPLYVWKPLRESSIDDLSEIGLTFLKQASKFRKEKPSDSWLHIWKELWNDEYKLDELRKLGNEWLNESILAAPKNSAWGAIWMMLWSRRSDSSELRTLANNCLNKSPNPPEVEDIKKAIKHNYRTNHLYLY